MSIDQEIARQLESDEPFQLLMEQSPLGIVLFTPDAPLGAGRALVLAAFADADAPTPVQAHWLRSQEAARQREQEKHKRYPGPGLCAAALEGGGRMGAELASFLRAHAPGEGADRAQVLADVRQRLVVALARGNAAMLLSSAGARPRPWPSPCQAVGAGRARRGRALGPKACGILSLILCV